MFVRKCGSSSLGPTRKGQGRQLLPKDELTTYKISKTKTRFIHIPVHLEGN